MIATAPISRSVTERNQMLSPWNRVAPRFHPVVTGAQWAIGVLVHKAFSRPSLFRKPRTLCRLVPPEDQTPVQPGSSGGSNTKGHVESSTRFLDSIFRLSVNSFSSPSRTHPSWIPLCPATRENDMEKNVSKSK
jgi:hypothetical protein